MTDLLNTVLSPRTGIRVQSEPQADNRRRHGRIRCDVAACELGEVIKSVPSAEDLAQEKFDHRFDVIIITAAEEKAVQDAVNSISEIAKVETNVIDLAAEEKAAATAPAASAPKAAAPAPAAKKAAPAKKAPAKKLLHAWAALAR